MSAMAKLPNKQFPVNEAKKCIVQSNFVETNFRQQQQRLISRKKQTLQSDLSNRSKPQETQTNASWTAEASNLEEARKKIIDGSVNEFC